MKKSSKNVKPEIEPVKTILRGQESMKVVLNGGKYELDDATIPFQIGFNQEVADNKPTHILVLDVTEPLNCTGTRKEFDSTAERTLFKIQPVQYLQLKEPGEHHLIFILLNDLSSEKRKWLLERRYGGYRSDLYFKTIEDLELDDQVAYCEAIISVPEVFFAKEPETNFGDAIWSWTNAWYDLDPVDQCEYRKRKIVAFTIKPILWTILFLLRLMVAVIYTTVSFVVRCFGFIVGYQAVSFFPNFKNTWWKFLVLYSGTEFDDFLEKDYWFGRALKDNESSLKRKDVEDWYPYKSLFIFGKKLHLPISLLGIVIYSALIYVYYMLLSALYFNQNGYSLLNNLLVLVCLAIASFFLAAGISSGLLPTITANENWVAKWDEDTEDGKKRINRLTSWLFFILMGIVFAVYIISKIKFAVPSRQVVGLFDLIIFTIISFILGFLLWKLYSLHIARLKNEELVEEDLIKKSKKLTAEEKQANWLKAGFDINNMPDKIDFKAIPEPSIATHKLVIAFWRTKASVCKPYAKK